MNACRGRDWLGISGKARDRIRGASLIFCASLIGWAAQTGAGLAETYRCGMKAQSIKVKPFVAEWIEIERVGGLAGAIVRDAYMEANGLKPIRAEIARENGKVLAIFWTSYPIKAGYRNAEIMPRFRLSYFKADKTVRMNYAAQTFETSIGASGRCVLKE